MNKNKNLYYWLGGLLVLALVAGVAVWSQGSQFQGMIRLSQVQPMPSTHVITPISPSVAPMPQATVYKGSCLVRDQNSNLPLYSDPDTGTGYAKSSKGTSFSALADVDAACTHADYASLAGTYCTQNPQGSYQMQIGLYNQDGSYKSTGASHLGANYIICSSVIPAVTYKGACIVQGQFANLPLYSDPDVGTGYAKAVKGSSFNALGEVDAACTQADYATLAGTYCTQNPQGSYQMQIVLYNQDGSYKSNGASHLGANYINCSAGTQGIQNSNPYPSVTLNPLSNMNLAASAVISAFRITPGSKPVNFISGAGHIMLNYTFSDSGSKMTGNCFLTDKNGITVSTLSGPGTQSGVLDFKAFTPSTYPVTAATDFEVKCYGMTVLPGSGISFATRFTSAGGTQNPIQWNDGVSNVINAGQIMFPADLGPQTLTQP